MSFWRLCLVVWFASDDKHHNNWLTDLLPSLPSSPPPLPPPPSWPVGAVAQMSSFTAKAKSLQMPHLFTSFAVPVFIIIFFSVSLWLSVICPEWALPERGPFVFGPGTQLFSASTVFSSSPFCSLVSSREICFLFLICCLFFFLLTSFYFSSSG